MSEKVFKLTFPIAIAILLSTLGCANFGKKKPATNSKYIEHVSKLEKEVRDLATQNTVLKTALKKPKAAETSTVVLSPKETSSEHSLYTAALEAYWIRDIEKLKRLNSMLLKTFPKSVHADNSLFLQASLLYNNGALGESLQTLDRIVKSYPHSNKVVSAELMKATIYSRLNLAEQSNEIYKRIVKQYPGSTEARQAALQITEKKSASIVMPKISKATSSKRTVK